VILYARYGAGRGREQLRGALAQSRAAALGRGRRRGGRELARSNKVAVGVARDAGVGVVE
jgi:hypothetical protein